MMAQREGFLIGKACQLAGVSRAGFYRQWAKHEPREAETDLRDAIQKIVLANRNYGYRRVTAALRQQGCRENHKRVLRLMRADNLLALQKQRKFVGTTNSRHGLLMYSNLAAGLEVTGIDQLWVADITYIRLLVEFVYLAVILDAFSRRVIGWALERTLEDDLTLQALGMALKRRNPAAGLVHHSDRGVQYASRDYTALLLEHGIRISMSRRGNPYDNALAESFIKTLKYEEVYRQEYRDLTEARASIPRFLEHVYNQKRLHSALGYLPPAEFEKSLENFAIGRPQRDDLGLVERPASRKSAVLESVRQSWRSKREFSEA